MTTVAFATFDGEVLRLEQPVPLKANARVRVTIEDVPDAPPPASFLRTARSLGLDGPADWSERLEVDLYGEPAGGA